MTKPTFTIADADRLLGLGDQMIEDWAITAKESGGDPDFVERQAEWEAIRPMLATAPELLEALKELMQLIEAHIPDEAENWTRNARAAIAKAGAA